MKTTLTFLGLLTAASLSFASAAVAQPSWAAQAGAPGAITVEHEHAPPTYRHRATRDEGWRAYGYSRNGYSGNDTTWGSNRWPCVRGEQSETSAYPSWEVCR
jgi:hypothetical protein